MYTSPLLASFKEYFIRNPKFVWVSYISLVNMAVDAGAAPRNAYNSAAKLIRDTMQYDVTVLPEYKEAMQALDDSNIRQGVIFVFGSNLAGRHGAGSAKHAAEYYGAIRGVGNGPMGQSYAIPTKGFNMETLQLFVISQYVKIFINYAKNHPDLKFQIVNIGCGLAGYKPEQIAPMFSGTPPNCEFTDEFALILKRYDLSNNSSNFED